MAKSLSNDTKLITHKDNHLSPATKQDVKQIVLDVMADFWEQFLLPELQKKADKTDIEMINIKLSSNLAKLS